MGPELHYQLVINRVAELREEASSHRRVQEAKAARKPGGGNRRIRAALGKFRAL